MTLILYINSAARTQYDSGFTTAVENSHSATVAEDSMQCSEYHWAYGD